MTRKIGVELVGDATSLIHAFEKASASATAFNRNITRTGREVSRGFGAISSIGKSFAFATGGFVAFNSLSEVLRSSVDAARGAATAQASLAAQMKTSGQSFVANRDQVEQTARAYVKLGFNSEQVTQSLAILDRGTGNIQKAFRLQGVTADLARAKNIQLADAASIVAKAVDGQASALRRDVPGLDKNAKGMDLIREAQQKLAGQAQAGTSVAAQFNAALFNLQEIIGTALLPALNRYLGKFATWMENTKNQKKVQKDANKVVGTTVSLFDDLAKAVGGASWAIGKYIGVIKHLPGGKYGVLQTLLTPFGIPRTILHLLGTLGPKGKDQGVVRQFGATMSGLSGSPGFAYDPTFGQQQQTAAARAAGRRAGFSLQGRFNIAQLKLAQAQLTATSADDIAILNTEKNITEQQIKQAKTLKDKTALTQQLAGIVGQINSLETSTSATMKTQNTTLKDRADLIKTAILDQLDRKQTAVTDQRAISDAMSQLHTARLLGGPQGIKLALQAVHDARFQAFRDTLANAPARLRGAKGGGQVFSLGNQIVIHINGVTDPAKVAQAVVAIIQRREKHTTSQMRGPSAGAGVK